jgi:hypothetical protein
VPSPLIPYDRPRGSIHDLAYLATLCANPCHLICVSDRTLYLLYNLADLDCAFASRYAIEFGDEHYRAVTDADPEWQDYIDAYEAFQLEVRDMSCDIEAGLEAIAEALGDLSINVSCGGGTGVVRCIQDLDNDELLGPGESEQGSPVTDPPPDGFATWEEYFDYKCKAAAFIWDLERKHMVALRTFDLISLTAAIVGPVIAGLAGVLPAAFTPAGFVVFVASVVAIGVVAAWSWTYMDQMIDWWDDNKQDIVCSLYNSGSSVEAVSGLSNALEDAIQAIVAWGALEPVSETIAGLLGEAFAQLAGNGVVEPLFKAVVAAQNYAAECEECEQPGCTAILVELGTDEVITEDTVYAVAEEDPYAYGVAIYFDVFRTNGLSYCLEYDGKNITDVTCTNNLATFEVYDRSGGLMDAFRLDGSDPPVFPYLSTGRIFMWLDSGQTVGSCTVYIEEPD